MVKFTTALRQKNQWNDLTFTLFYRYHSYNSGTMFSNSYQINNNIWQSMISRNTFEIQVT